MKKGIHKIIPRYSLGLLALPKENTWVTHAGNAAIYKVNLNNLQQKSLFD